MQDTHSVEELLKTANQRLYPSLTNPNWLVLRRRREIFQKWIGRETVRELNVLDVGGRVQPYRPLLEGRIQRYLAVDLLKTPLVNIVARGEQIPLASAQFDLVICTQVLEYIPEPGAVIEEIHRVLKPGGCLWLSVPAVFPRDSDHECWRFLPASLRLLMTPFRESEIIPEGGTVVGFFRTINACFNIFVRYPMLRSVFEWTLCPLVNLSGELLTLIARSKNDQFAPNYSVWARK